MTRIILVRHGQSEANLNSICSGQIDFPLTETGHLQAEMVAKYLLSTERIDRVYSSDLRRAIDTVAPVARALGLTVITDKRLREIDTGRFSGISFEERNKKYPEAYETLLNDFSHMRYPDGEYVPEVYDRVVECVLEIAAECDGETVLIASHNGALRVFDAFAHGYSREEVGMVKGFKNAAISVYELDGVSVKIIKHNVTEHILTETDDNIPDTDKQ